MIKSTYMQLSKISQLFKQEISIRDFKEAIAGEISNYKNSLKKKGGSQPIILNEDLQHLEVSGPDIKIICKAYLEGIIDKWELNYIAEAILLSSTITFTDDRSESALYALSDPEFFELLTDNYVRQIIKDLE